MNVTCLTVGHIDVVCDANAAIAGVIRVKMRCRFQRQQFVNLKTFSLMGSVLFWYKTDV